MATRVTKQGSTGDEPKDEDKDAGPTFTVDAALLFQLGEELVNKRSVALAELIKNAYDADARQVTLTFSKVRVPGGTIEIDDDGDGLSLVALEQKWLRIATRAKVDEPRSPRFQRWRAGAKGVGRFAARRLAAKLSLDSVARSEDQPSSFEHVTAEFDWSRFAPGVLLEKVTIPVTREILEKEPDERGVTLTLSGVRDAWSAEDVEELNADLLRLVTTPKKGDVDDFKIRLVADEFPAFAGDIADRFLDYALFKLHGDLDAEGNATYELTVRGEKHKRKFSPLKDGPKPTAKGRDKEKEEEKEKQREQETKFPLVGPATFDIAFFVYKSTFFAGLPIKTRDAQQRGREHGGVHIYVDRFRVPPYGDVGDDWLNLDEDRGGRWDATPEVLTLQSKAIEGRSRPMLLLPGNNQLFGSVHLSRENNASLKQTVNRERFIENASFDQLKAFVRLGINWMTVQYAGHLAAERNAAPKDGPVELIKKARSKFVETIEGSALGDHERTEVVQAFDLAMHAVQAREDELISELSMLRVLASTGTMIAVFEHQLMASLSGLTELASRVQRLVRQASDSTRKKLEDESSALKGWIGDLQHQANLIGLLLSKEGRSRRRRVVVHQAVQTVADSFSSFMDENAIKFVNAVPVTLKTPALYPAEFTAVLLNLFTNALKAVRHGSERKIQASAERKDGHVVVRVSDTGIGADPEQWEDFFLPFTTTSTPDPMLGHGTGLGLKIVRDMAAIYGGTARFVPPTPPWKTTLEIALPEQ